jgi:hypothetical protein
MIRTAGSKLIVRNPVASRVYPDEFYDSSQDPRETRNLIREPGCAATIAGLRERLSRYFARWETPERSGWDVSKLPRFNPQEAWQVDAPLFAPPSPPILSPS